MLGLKDNSSINLAKAAEGWGSQTCKYFFVYDFWGPN